MWQWERDGDSECYSDGERDGERDGDGECNIDGERNIVGERNGDGEYDVTVMLSVMLNNMTVMVTVILKWVAVILKRTVDRVTLRRTTMVILPPEREVLKWSVVLRRMAMTVKKTRVVKRAVSTKVISKRMDKSRATLIWLTPKGMEVIWNSHTFLLHKSIHFIITVSLQYLQDFFFVEPDRSLL